MKHFVRLVCVLVALAVCAGVSAGEKRGYDAQHLKLELSFDIPARKVFGRATHTVKALQPLSIIELDAVNLVIKQVSRSDGAPVIFNTTPQKLIVDMSKLVAAGQTVTFSVTYEATPNNRGLHILTSPYPQIWSMNQTTQARFWFPCYDAPDDKITHEVMLTVPKSFIGVSNGALVGVTEDAKSGTKTYHWLQDKPNATYLLSVNVAEFAEIEDGNFKGKPIIYYVHKSKAHMAKPTFGKTPSVLKFFSECTGFDYPWDKCAMIAVTGFPGGMENTSTTMIGEVLLHDGRVRSPASDSVVAHELAHQWFGDLVTCKDWAHSWLNESFATYFDLLYTEHERGKAEFQRRIMGNQRLGLAASTMRPRPIVYTQYKVVGEMFDQNAYAKGACVLHMLRYVLGERLWWEGVRHYLRKHAYQSVDTDDFRKAMEEKSGCDLKWFFDQWLYGVGHPQFQVRWSWNETAKKVTVAIRQTQSAGATVPVFRTPADLEFKTTTKVHRFKVDITAAQQEFSFQLDNKPQSLVFDPDHWLLCTADVQQD